MVFIKEITKFSLYRMGKSFINKQIFVRKISFSFSARKLFIIRVTDLSRELKFYVLKRKRKIKIILELKKTSSEK